MTILAYTADAAAAFVGIQVKLSRQHHLPVGIDLSWCVSLNTLQFK